MTDIVSTCRSTWKRLGVPPQARADLEFELRTNLDAAAADGVDAATFVGRDPSGLAREWAVARSLVRSRWLVAGSVLTALIVGWASLEIFQLLLFGPGNSLDRHMSSVGFGWSFLLLVLQFAWLLVPVLGSVSVYLRLAHDRLGARTVATVVAASPVTLWLSASMGFALGSLGGAPAEPLRISLVFALLLGAIRAAIVVVDRRTGPLNT